MKSLSLLFLIILSTNSFAKDCSIVTSNFGKKDTTYLQYEFGYREVHSDLNKQADFGIKLEVKDFVSNNTNPFGNPIIIKLKKFSLYEDGNIIFETKYSNPEKENPLIEVVSKLRTLGCVVR